MTIITSMVNIYT